MQRNDKTKEKGFGLLGAVNCGKVNFGGKLVGGKCSLVRSVMQRQVSAISSERIISYWYGRGKEDTFRKRNLCYFIYIGKCMPCL